MTYSDAKKVKVGDVIAYKIDIEREGVVTQIRKDVFGQIAIEVEALDEDNRIDYLDNRSHFRVLKRGDKHDKQ